MPRQVLNLPSEPLPPLVNEVARQIVNAAYKVHSTLGPGLLENVYEICLEHELTKSGLTVIRQMGLPIVYDNVQLDGGLRPGHAGGRLHGGGNQGGGSPTAGAFGTGLDLPQAFRPTTGVPGQFQRCGHQRRHQAHNFITKT